MRKGISTILAVSITVLIMLSLFVGGWYYFNQKWQSEKKSQEERISTLNKDIADLKKAMSVSESKIEADTEQPPSTTVSTLATYTSSKYGYSFQYPKTFSLVDWMWDGQSETRLPQEGKVVWLSKTALGEKAIPMDADPISQYFSISVSDQLCGLSQLASEGVTVTDIKFLGLNGWRRDVIDITNSFGGLYETSYHVNKGSYCYNLTWVNSDANGAHDAEIDAMVASFKLN